MSSFARSAVVLYDRDLRVTRLNAAARELPGAHAWIGRPLPECLASLHGAPDTALERKALLEHASRGSAFPVRIGDSIWRAELSALSDSETSSSQSVGALLLYEVGKAEDYRDLALDRVDFLAALSHDLRTPLNAMLGWLHLLSMPQRGPELAARAIAGLRLAVEQQQGLLADWADRAHAGHAEARQLAGDAPAQVAAAPMRSSGASAQAAGASPVLAADTRIATQGGGCERRTRKPSRRLRFAQPCSDGAVARRRPRLASADGVAAVHGDTGSGLSGVFVLAVDDRPEMLDVLTQVLAADGASIETTTSADDALARYPDWAASGGERLLVSDLAMPGRDGFSLIREIRALERHRRMPRLPAVALSAHGLPDVRRRAIENGYDLFVDKPVDPRVLLGRLHRLLDR